MKIEKKQKVEPEPAQITFHPDMTNEQLEALLRKSLEDIPKSDPTLSDAFAIVMKGLSAGESLSIRLLRVIRDQNKILIIQNELLRRALIETKTNVNP